MLQSLHPMNPLHTIPLALLACATLSTHAFSASVITNTNNSDEDWEVTGFSVGGEEQYDETTLSIIDAAGLKLDSVRIVFDLSGTYDDSLTIDIQGDGVIDYVASQPDAYATPGVGRGSGNYQPWIDASPATIDILITATGTTVTTSWNGVEINVDAVNDFTNTISSFTLEHWGLNADGTVPDNNFTSTGLRIGNLNSDGPGGHNLTYNYDALVLRDHLGNPMVFDPDGDGLPPTVSIPEPSSTISLLLGSILLIHRKRKL